MPCVCCAFSYFQFDYSGPILGLRLLNLGLTETQAGLFFCIAPFAYILACVAMPFLPKGIPKKAWIIFGVLIAFPAHLLNGPS